MIFAQFLLCHMLRLRQSREQHDIIKSVYNDFAEIIMPCRNLELEDHFLYSPAATPSAVLKKMLSYAKLYRMQRKHCA